MTFKYLTYNKLIKMTDRELIQYKKELQTHRNNLQYELSTKLRSHNDELIDVLQDRLSDRKKDLEIAKDDREHCLSSGYNIALLSIN